MLFQPIPQTSAHANAFIYTTSTRLLGAKQGLDPHALGSTAIIAAVSKYDQYSKFTDEFDAINEPLMDSTLTDYDEFKNKQLLDKLRNKIIQNLIDNQKVNNLDMNDFIKTLHIVPLFCL